MRKKLNICQVTPGLLPIPPKGWGAIEKIIWQYKLSLERLGHIVDIKYLDEIDLNNNPYDIIHIHVANLVIEAKKRNLSVIFSLHDHHVMIRDFVYKENEHAVYDSSFAIAHGSNILNKFQHTNKVYQLPHGVDTSFYKNLGTSKYFDLLCVANNGLAGDNAYDRKGFRLAIESAKELGMSITIMGPSNNDNFFNANKDLLDYKKLTILRDFNDEQLLNLYNDHKVFLHLSNLEAGHPNLTLLEALACGLPIIGTTEATDLEGMEVVTLEKSNVCDAIKKVFSNYEDYSKKATKTANRYSWDNIVEQLELLYFSGINRESMRGALDRVYKTKRDPNNTSTDKYFYNFHNGVFFEFKSNEEKDISVKFIDKDTNNVIYQNEKLHCNHWAAPNIKYYTNWRININDSINYDLELEDKNVLIHLSSKALGDNIAWIPFAEEFRLNHKCKLSVTTFWNNLFQKSYPDINFKVPGQSLAPYAAYYEVGCFDNDTNKNKFNWRSVPLQKVASDMLGIKYKEIKSKVDYTYNSKIEDIGKPYVAISEASTLQSKYWNNPIGWKKVIEYLKDSGYEVVLVQKEKNTGLDNVIKKVGLPIDQTIHYIKNAEFFIGLGSGLSWLAWALDKKVILISGFSLPFSEFFTPYRVINTGVCHGCYNDISYSFDRGNWNWCPKNQDFICTKSISHESVIEKIDQIIK